MKHQTFLVIPPQLIGRFHLIGMDMKKNGCFFVELCSYTKARRASSSVKKEGMSEDARSETHQSVAPHGFMVGFGPENVGLIFPMIASHLYNRDNDQQNHKMLG